MAKAVSFRQEKQVCAEVDEKNLGKLSQNSDITAIMLQRALLPSEVIERLETQRRWDLILGPLGVI